MTQTVQFVSDFLATADPLSSLPAGTTKLFTAGTQALVTAVYESRNNMTNYVTSDGYNVTTANLQVVPGGTSNTSCPTGYTYDPASDSCIPSPITAPPMAQGMTGATGPSYGITGNIPSGATGDTGSTACLVYTITKDYIAEPAVLTPPNPSAPTSAKLFKRGSIVNASVVNNGALGNITLTSDGYDVTTASMCSTSYNTKRANQRLVAHFIIIGLIALLVIWAIVKMFSSK